MISPRERTPDIEPPRPAGGTPLTPPPYLGTQLVADGQLTSDQLVLALGRRRRTAQLAQTLIDMELVSADAVLDVLSRQYGVPSTRVNAYTVSARSVVTIPEPVASRYGLMALLEVGGILVVAMVRPDDAEALDAVRSSSGLDPEPLVALEGEIRQAIGRYYRPAGRRGGDELTAVVVRRDDRPPPAFEGAAETLERLLTRAREDGASDVHFVPAQDRVSVRLRVDGQLLEVTHLPAATAALVLALVKHLARLDVLDRRNPQNGVFDTRMGRHTIDAQVATYPTIWGELVRVTPEWNADAVS